MLQPASHARSEPRRLHAPLPPLPPPGLPEQAAVHWCCGLCEGGEVCGPGCCCLVRWTGGSIVRHELQGDTPHKRNTEITDFTALLRYFWLLCVVFWRRCRSGAGQARVGVALVEVERALPHLVVGIVVAARLCHKTVYGRISYPAPPATATPFPPHQPAPQLRDNTQHASPPASIHAPSSPLSVITVHTAQYSTVQHTI